MTLTTHPPAPLAAMYDRAARSWQAGIDKLGYPGAYDHLMRAVHPEPAERVIDVGTGSGAFAAAYLRAAAPPRELDLLDPIPAMLREAETRLAGTGPMITSLLGGIGATDVPEGAYDTVLTAHVIEHVTDPGAALTWLARRLRPGGRLYLSASRPHWCTALLRWKWGHAAWRPDRMCAMLARAGLTEVSHIPYRAGPPSRTSAGYTALRAR